MTKTTEVTVSKGDMGYVFTFEPPALPTVIAAALQLPSISRKEGELVTAFLKLDDPVTKAETIAHIVVDAEVGGWNSDGDVLQAASYMTNAFPGDVVVIDKLSNRAAK